MSLYAHIWLFMIYIQFAKSRFAPESRIPNSIGLAVLLGCCGRQVEMANVSFIINYLKNTYSEYGSISQQFDHIFEFLQVDKNEAIDAFYEIYSTESHPALYPSYEKDACHFSSVKLIQRLTSIAPPNNIDRLAISYIIYDITKEKIQHLNKKLTNDDINLALKNIEVINFDLGVFMQCINAQMLSTYRNDLKKSIQALGGLTRSKKYQTIKNTIIKDWKASSYHSYAECARKHAVIHGLSTKTIEKWLSDEFKKTQHGAKMPMC